jgi:hypothetical protein
MAFVPVGAILKLWAAKGQFQFFKNRRGKWELQSGSELIKNGVVCNQA